MKSLIIRSTKLDQKVPAPQPQPNVLSAQKPMHLHCRCRPAGSARSDRNAGVCALQ